MYRGGFLSWYYLLLAQEIIVEIVDAIYDCRWYYLRSLHEHSAQGGRTGASARKYPQRAAIIVIGKYRRKIVKEPFLGLSSQVTACFCGYRKMLDVPRRVSENVQTCTRERMRIYAGGTRGV